MKRILLVGLASLASLAASPANSQLRADAGFGAMGLEGCRTDLRYLNQMFGWQVNWVPEWRALGQASDAELEEAIKGWSEAPAALRAAQAALDSSTPAEAAPRVIVERVIPQLDDLAKSLDAGPPALREGVSPRLKAEWDALFTGGIKPAVDHYRTFLRDRYLAKASAASGLSGTPDGERCFRQSVREFTSLDLPPDQIEQIGWRLLRETEADLAKLHDVKLPDMPQLLEKLRTERDAGFTEERLIAVSEAAIARGSAAVPRMFHQPLKQPVRVDPMPKAMEASFAADSTGRRRAASPQPMSSTSRARRIAA